MTFVSPAYVIQGASHGAQSFRGAFGFPLAQAGGIAQAGDLALTQNGSPNMSVNIAPGRVVIPGTSLPTINPGGGAYYPQGLYYTENDATVNMPISASDPTNPRIDTVIVQVQDAAYAGVTNSVGPAVVTGTPTNGATLVNLTGAGAVPVSSLVLGYVLVPANATTIVTADLSSTAAQAYPGLGVGGAASRGAVNIATSQSRTNVAYGTLATPDQVTGIVLPTNGLIAVRYQATWQESVAGAARAAIFVGSNQLRLAGAAPQLEEAATGASSTASTAAALFSFGGGLASFATQGQGAYSGDVTTGQVVGGYGLGAGSGGPTFGIAGGLDGLTGAFGGACEIFGLPAGTYTISVQFKASSGSVTASNRKLWVQALPFG